MTRRLLVAVLALLALAGGCGLSEDDGPQAIAPENLPPELLDPTPDTSTTVPAGATTVTVYFIEQVGDRERLVAVEREVQNGTDPGDRVGALLAQPPSDEEAASGISSSITADTTLPSAPVFIEARNEIVIDLSSEFVSIEGRELAKAFAQIVWTVTELESIDQVRFLVDGVETRALDAEGAEQEGAVNRAQYNALRPAS
ncbi:MAG: GerMN domain-containing protein [Acidimicrobiales bacterium]